MRSCCICHFETDLDDVVLSMENGACVCLRCYGRETGSALRMPKGLRAMLTAVLASSDLQGSARAAEFP
jgi:hypothetical protein